MGWAKYFEDNNEMVMERMRNHMWSSERYDFAARVEVPSQATIPHPSRREIVVTITGKYVTERRL